MSNEAITEPVPRRSRVGTGDWIMVLLAIASVVLLAYATFWHVPDHTLRVIYWVDAGFCVIFAVEFLARWRRAGWRRAFLVRNWYDLLGMIPAIAVSYPALRSFRLIRIIRVVVLLSRLGAAIDRTVGEEFTYRLVNRFTNAVIDAIKQPLTEAVLDEVIVVLRTGHYASNLANAIAENKIELRGMVLDKLRNDPELGRLRLVPFHDEIVKRVTDAVLRIVLEMLADPRTNELISDVLRDNVDQIRAAVHSRDHHKHRDALTS